MRAVVALVMVCLGVAAQAAELSYALQSPLVGGNNAHLLHAENARMANIKQKDAARQAEERLREANATRDEANSPAARFARALESQLYHSLSSQVVNDINNLKDGGTGSFRTGDTTIGYRNEGGTLHVTITTPTGVSTLEMPAR